MEALESPEGNLYSARTSLEASEINIKASGTSENGKTNATFKALSNVDKDASIRLKATGENGIKINYVDTLNKEKKQDIFYAQGKTR